MTIKNNQPIQIEEELSADLRSVIDSEQLPVHAKHTSMARVFRTLLKRGSPTGLSDEKPKKGSSRAVYFPSEADDINIDGHATKMHSVLKIAYPGKLDKYNDSGSLFGEHQNLAEGDQYLQNTHGMLRKDHDGKYTTNPDGILAPVVHSHDEGHYLQMGKIDPIKAGDFREFTKTKDFPKGISHDEFYDACNHEHAECNGRTHYGKYSSEQSERVKSHPLVSHAISFMLDHGAHPGDFVKGNMGVWTHPVAGTKHIVLSDYGYSNTLATQYSRARLKMFRSY